MRHHTPATAPPAEGWVLICTRQFSSGGVRYPVGAEVPISALGRNGASMLSNKFVTWRPPGTPIAAQARELPASIPQKPNPAVQVVHDSKIPNADSTGCRRKS
jgi:hypothetical protein